jgi:hypothetical protein
MNRGEFVAGMLALAAPSGRLSPVRFELGGTYFSSHLEIVPEVDPEVFVTDATVLVGGIGLAGIEHVAGLRALRLDDPDLPLYTAAGARMGFTSKRWLAADGSASLSASGTEAQAITLSFTHLVVFGAYALFKQVAGASGTALIPLDGTGASSTFTAGHDGSANLTIDSPQALDSHSAIVLIYNSDGRKHNLSPGPLGITAHLHLIAPLGPD